MNETLFKAILSMDSYNRGYDRGVDLNTVLNTTKIGTATVISQVDIEPNSAARNIGFYALAYDLKDANDEIIETVVAYRGTDYPNGGPTLPKDIQHGWLLGGGLTDTAQGLMAVEFFNAVVDQKYGTSIQANDNHMRPRKAA